MSYKSDLLGRLKSPEYRAAYLAAALADSREAFLVALRDVAEALGMRLSAELTETNSG